MTQSTSQAHLAAGAATPEPKSGGALKIGALLAAMALLIGLSSVLPIQAWLLDFVGWVRQLGVAGAAVFGVAYIVAAVLALPASLLTIGGGFVYGPWIGTLIVSPVSVAAAAISFLIARTLGRSWAEKRAAEHPRFGALDEAVAEGGWKVVALVRLSPIFPFALVNYGLGLTRVSFLGFVFGSWLGMLPGTFLYVYLGSLVTSLAGLGDAGGAAEGSTARLIFGIIGALATVAVVVVITRLAKRKLDEKLAEAEAG